MKHCPKHRHRTLSCLVAVAALGAGACSQSPSPSNDGVGNFDNTTGALIAHLKRIPDDVRCLEIQTSDWRRQYVQLDVEPGSEATLRIAPLTPGYVSFWGAAYFVRCWDIYSDAGPYGNQSWVADYASAYVNSGAATPVTLTFHRLGSADVSVDFDDSTCDAGQVGSRDGAAPPCLPPATVDGGAD